MSTHCKPAKPAKGQRIKTHESTPSVLYHFSPTPRIKTLLPGKHRGKMRVVWMFRSGARDWAFHHVSEHQGTDRLYLYRCDLRGLNVRRWRSGIYTCAQSVPVECIGRFGLAIVKVR